MLRALVVDDDPEILRPLAKLVEREGFTTRTCESLAKARSQLAGETWDVVIADLSLPDGSALDLLSQIEDLAQTVRSSSSPVTGASTRPSRHFGAARSTT